MKKAYAYNRRRMEPGLVQPDAPRDRLHPGTTRCNGSRGGKSQCGLRTFPLVAMAACGYTLVGFSILGSTDAEARVLQGIITGIGFIGGGAILKSKATVTGTATAASIWTTGLIGIAVASDRYEIAALLSVLTFLTLAFRQTTKIEGLRGRLNFQDRLESRIENKCGARSSAG